MPRHAIGAGQIALSHFANLFKSATLVLYSGTQPATPETTVTGGNLTLATFQFADPPFSSVANSSGFNSVTGSFVSTTVTPSNNGTIAFARAYMTLVSSHAGAWTTATAYAKGDIVTSNSSYWMCLLGATSSTTAPTGTNVLAFDDGASVWTWIGPTTAGLVLGDYTVGTNSTFDVLLPSLTVSTSVNQTITNFQFSLSAS